MLKKAVSKDGKKCKVTFELPADVNAESAFLVGDFNDWDESAQPMKQRKDGSFSTAVSLITGQTYHFRYLLDGERWENDWEADNYVPNIHGSDDSIVEV